VTDDFEIPKCGTVAIFLAVTTSAMIPSPIETELPTVLVSGTPNAEVPPF
jgi:hypothetical protein